MLEASINPAKRQIIDYFMNNLGYIYVNLAYHWETLVSIPK